MRRLATFLILALFLSSCFTRLPLTPLSGLPVVTWAMANEWAWQDEAARAVRDGMEDVNRACGRPLLRESRSAAVTVHHKGMADTEAEMLGILFGSGTILGLADPNSRTFALYPAAFVDDWTLRNTTSHEMLHILGLRHNNVDVITIMHSYTSHFRELDRISDVDVKALNRLGYACRTP